MNIKDFRKQYKMYDDLSDDEIVEKLHDKFYPNLSIKTIRKMLVDLLQPEENKVEIEILEVLKTIIERMEDIAKKPIPTPLVTVKAPVVNVAAPKIPEIKVPTPQVTVQSSPVSPEVMQAFKRASPVKEWDLTVHRNENYLIDNITIKAVK